LEPFSPEAGPTTTRSSHGQSTPHARQVVGKVAGLTSIRFPLTDIRLRATCSGNRRVNGLQAESHPASIVFEVCLQKSTPSQPPPKSVNTSFAITHMRNKFTDLCGNRHFQNTFKNTLCEIKWKGGAGRPRTTSPHNPTKSMDLQSWNTWHLVQIWSNTWTDSGNPRVWQGVSEVEDLQPQMYQTVWSNREGWWCLMASRSLVSD